MDIRNISDGSMTVVFDKDETDLLLHLLALAFGMSLRFLLKLPQDNWSAALKLIKEIRSENKPPKAVDDL